MKKLVYIIVIFSLLLATVLSFVSLNGCGQGVTARPSPIPTIIPTSSPTQTGTTSPSPTPTLTNRPSRSPTPTPIPTPIPVPTPRWTNILNNGVSSEPYTSVFFVDTLEGWVVGNRGSILHTVNGGDIWETQSSGTTEPLHRVFMVDKDNGWIIVDANYLLKTTNEGSSWEKIDNPMVYNPLFDVFFITSLEGYVVGGNGLAYTSDGEHFSSPQSLVGIGVPSGIIFSNSIGLIVGTNGSIWRNDTPSNPSNWILESTPTTENLYDVDMIDNVAIAIGSNKIALWSNNGGISWQQSPILQNAIEVSMGSTTEAWIVGNFGSSIHHSTNAGTSWTTITNAVVHDEQSVFMIDSTHGFIVGSQYGGHGAEAGEIYKYSP